MPEAALALRFLRELALSRYLAALERGDMDSVLLILDQASRDEVLEQMIFALHDPYPTEEAFLQMVHEVQNEPDILEVEDGVFKSRLGGKLPDLKLVPRRRYRAFRRAGQILAVALLAPPQALARFVKRWRSRPEAADPLTPHLRLLRRDKL
jgi:hypothetical protein